MDCVDTMSSGLNGFYLCDKFLVRELVTLILSYVDFESIIDCRLVCKQWNAIIAEQLFWKHKTLLENKLWPKIPQAINFPWSFYANLYLHHPFERNLIRNPNGKEKLHHWTILSQGGDGFQVENPPCGSDDIPVNENTCFATSYHSCSKEQIIDLSSLGFTHSVLEQFKPKIVFRDWYAGRFDCGCIYECTFALLAESKEVIDEFTFRDSIDQGAGTKWKKIEHTFENYPADVRYLKFYHGGTDRQYWAGHYGAKLTGSSIIMSSILSNS